MLAYILYYTSAVRRKFNINVLPSNKLKRKLSFQSCVFKNLYTYYIICMQYNLSIMTIPWLVCLDSENKLLLKITGLTIILKT